jgi:hypothetical protein
MAHVSVHRDTVRIGSSMTAGYAIGIGLAAHRNFVKKSLRNRFAMRIFPASYLLT